MVYVVLYVAPLVTEDTPRRTRIAIVGTVFFDSVASGHDLGGAFGVAAWVVVALGLVAALAGFLLPHVRPTAAAPSAAA